MLIDAHAHAFPSAELGREWQTLLRAEAEPRRSGELGELTRQLPEAGINYAALLLYPRSGARHERLRRAGHAQGDIRTRLRDELRELNRWGCRAAASDPRFLPFAGIDVRYLSADEIVEEIDAVAALGARGIKFIPPSMELYANDPLLWPVYQRCSELGLPVLSQSGVGGGPPRGRARTTTAGRATSTTCSRASPT